ncbi:uncharacterized protein SPSK_09506 [Sporothrix schenckii 1099-18]|uniref:DUF7598 domain-containing protein n=2 Tax=Sporothrix schenckii TaxID=29908 RepID=U7PYM8_SPOS1|nr:uncharacterized protein SPSK_09506 [Sporothrix schenckii 1099-18]ERT00027.1 hypothetical protein HMPREF1624_03396 [Sporothrix schenckii ATCC 58251]KJR85548.1 hypothetical protein SPSK_09506 [Sporothrix schenckii 1099-18]
MFNLSGNTKLRGIGYRALNVLRPCNIIALIAIVAASWVMIVISGVTGQFFFFDAITHVFTSSIAIFLILTEIQWGFLKRYFERSWPAFSDRHGFLWLGLAMVVLGCDMLGNLNKPVFSIKNIGLPLWRLIMAAGILSLTFGFFNFVATIIFRDGPSGLTARMIRADGNLADGGKLGSGIGSGNPADYYAATSSNISRSNTRRYNKEEMTYGSSGSSLADEESAAANNPPVNRFKRMTQVFKKSPFLAHGQGGLAGKKIQISHPLPVGNYDDETAGIANQGASVGMGGGDYYSHTNDAATVVDDNDHDHDRDHDARSQYHEDRSSPIIPEIRRPPTAQHPAMSSHYSVANMSRF